MAPCKQEKLWLVLDLDHTLLHTVEEEVSFSVEDMAALEKLGRRRGFGTPQYSPDMFMFPDDTDPIFTKLRPFVHDFLREASQMFHLCVCTMGKRDYAEMMVSLLDPEGLLFQGRMICREDMVKDDGKKWMKNLEALPCVPRDPSKFLILDDTPDVWPKDEFAANLIVIDRYIFLPCEEDEDSEEGPLLRSKWLDENEARGPLSKVLSLLRGIHHTLSISLNPRDVRDVLRRTAYEPDRPWMGYSLLPVSHTPSFVTTPASAAADAKAQPKLEECLQLELPSRSMRALRCY